FLSSAKFSRTFISFRPTIESGPAGPLQFSTQSDHFTHNNHGWRLDFCLASQIGDCLHSPQEAFLRRLCSDVNQRYGTMRLTTAFQKTVHDLFQIMQAHEDNEGVYTARKLTPLDLTV